MSDPLTYVLGLGNVLMGDDGFGPEVVRAFQEQYEVCGEVSVVDLGTPGLDLTPWLIDASLVVIVDTIRTNLPPGALRCYEKHDLLQHAPTARVGPHDPGLSETLHTLEFAGRGPERVHLIGAVPAATGMSLTLSHALRAAVPEAVRLVAACLTSAGYTVTRRLVPAVDIPWWVVPECRQQPG